MGDGISEMEVDGFKDALNSRTMDQILSRVTDDLAYQDEMRGGGLGKDDFGRIWTGLLAAFPDAMVQTRRTVISGFTAALEATIIGTNTGGLPLPDGQILPPTNRKVNLEVAWIWEFAEDGKVRSFRSYGNPSRMFGQLGLSPPTAQPAADTSP
jgi:predicted ester cyclase